MYATESAALSSNVERLVLLGSADIDGNGNELDNVITGNTGGNYLNGGAGKDHLFGGLGDDRYAVNQTDDVVVEQAGEGIDTVVSFAGSYTLAANLENLELANYTTDGELDYPVTAIGNDLANTLIGNDVNNVLDGAQGADSMQGALAGC